MYSGIMEPTIPCTHCIVDEYFIGNNIALSVQT